MPKRKSNVNKKPKQKSKTRTRTRTISKKTGLKKSTKIIIGVVCVLAIAGIVVGVLVSKRIISSNDNNLLVLKNQSKKNLIADSNIYKAIQNENFIDYNTFNDKLLENYVNKIRLIFNKKLQNIYLKKNIIEKIIDYSGVFDGGNIVILQDGTNFLDSKEHKNFFKLIPVFFNLVSTDNLDIVIVKTLYTLGTLTKDKMADFDGDVNCNNNNSPNCITTIDYIKLDSSVDKILNNISEMGNDFITKLYEIKNIKPLENSIMPEKKDIKITSEQINEGNKAFEYKTNFFNEVYKYYILNLNYEYIKLKYEYLYNISLPNTSIYEFLNNPNNKISEFHSYIYLNDLNLSIKRLILNIEDLTPQKYSWLYDDYVDMLDKKFIDTNYLNNSGNINIAFKTLTDILVEKKGNNIELIKSVTEEDAFNATTEKLKEHNQDYIDKFKNNGIDIETLSGLEEINELILANLNKN